MASVLYMNYFVQSLTTFLAHVDDHYHHQMNVKSNAQIVHSQSEEVHSIVGTSPERINNSKNDDFFGMS